MYAYVTGQSIQNQGRIMTA